MRWRIGVGLLATAMGCRPSARTNAAGDAGANAPPMILVPDVSPLPESLGDADAVLAELHARYGEGLEVEARVDGPVGQTLLVYSIGAGDDPPDPAAEEEPCRIARARWIGGGNEREIDLTPSQPQPGRAPDRMCMGLVDVSTDDVLGIGEALLTIHAGRGWSGAPGEPLQRDYVIDTLWVQDPTNGREILNLDLAWHTVGETFSAGIKRRLSTAQDGTVVVEVLEFDETDAEECHAAGREDCLPAFEIEDRYRWDPTTRTLVRLD